MRLNKLGQHGRVAACRRFAAPARKSSVTRTLSRMANDTQEVAQNLGQIVQGAAACLQRDLTTCGLRLPSR